MTVRSNLKNKCLDHHGTCYGSGRAQIPPRMFLLWILWCLHRGRRFLRVSRKIKTLLVTYADCSTFRLLNVAIFSGQCYKRQMQPLQRTARFPFARKPHSIRLVEIPGGQKGIKLSEDSVHGVSAQCFTISQ